jgi:hypothetical protein
MGRSEFDPLVYNETNNSELLLVANESISLVPVLKKMLYLIKLYFELKYFYFQRNLSDNFSLRGLSFPYQIVTKTY